MESIISYENCEFNDIYNQTIADMKRIDTYKDEFIPAITRYTQMRVSYDILMSEWEKSGFKVMEKYKNKSGASNNRKTALYQAIENLRKELLEFEGVLGLTPLGLKRLHDKILDQPKTSKLADLLAGGK